MRKKIVFSSMFFPIKYEIIKNNKKITILEPRFKYAFKKNEVKLYPETLSQFMVKD